MKPTMSRRALLKSLGLAGLTLPLLQVSRSVAETITFPKRLVVFAVPNGTVMSNFWPGEEMVFGSILKPLEPLKSKLLVLRGVDRKSALVTPVPKDHWPDDMNMLTARQALGSDNSFQPGGISIDQHIAAAIGDQTKFASLHLGVQQMGKYHFISALGPKAQVAPQNSPYKAFDMLFADWTADPNGLQKLRDERQSVLDAVQGRVQTLRCRLAKEDRDKLDIHLGSIQELEKQLHFTVASDACTPPSLGAPISVTGNDNHPKLGKLQMDIVAAALTCDLTRVVTLQWGWGLDHRLIPTWLDIPYNQHDIAHSNAPMTSEQQTAWLTTISKWYGEQFLYLCQKLDAIPEGDGTLLDNTAILWAHEQAKASSHSRVDNPYVIAGSCGGAIKTGRAIHFNGKAHNGLLMALANAMDVPTESFGDPEFSDGPFNLAF